MGLAASMMVVGIVTFSAPASAATRPFAARFGGANAAGGSAVNGVYNGDITMAANTLLSCSWPLSTATTSACYKNQTGTTASGINDDKNDAAPMVFVDADGTAAQPTAAGGTISTFNSSSADINLPANATVLYAGLYWGARISTTGAAITLPATAAAKGTVQFRTPVTAYKAITAISGGTNPASELDVDASGTTDSDYAAFRDVTAELKAVETANGTVNGTYWVANLNASLNAQAYGGWSLVVAYADPKAPARQLTIFDGYQVDNSTGAATSTSVPLTGFRTPPSGVVKTKLGLVTYEGDATNTGDYVTLGNFTTGTPPANVVYDTLHPYGTAANSDFFTSSISRPNAAGVQTPVTTKNPNFQNQYGFDASIVNADGRLPNSTLPTDSFTMVLATIGDTYFPQVITTAIDVFVPDYSNNIFKSVVDLTNPTSPQVGDTLEYTINMTNTGNDPADLNVLTDMLPPGVTYVPNSLKVDAVSQTDTAETSGIDTANICPATTTASAPCPKVTTSPYVVARVGTGATATAGGSITIAAAAVVKFRVTINPGFGPGSTITNIANLDYIQHTLTAAGTSTSTAGIIGAATTPLTPDLVPGSDTGVSSVDNITSATLPVFTGTANPGATVSIYDGTTLLGSAVASPTGLYSFSPLSPLTQGAHSFTATAAFGSGVASPPSSAISVTIDTTAPAPSAPTIAAASDSGISNSDNLTNVTSPTIVGTTEPNAIVNVYDAAVLLGTATANSSGAWSLVPPTAFAVGTHPLTTTVTDLAGNVTPVSSTTVVTIDTSAALTFPSIVSPSLNLQPTFAGTADPFSVITLRDARYRHADV
jgi:uncharacterized repeat protein (TIGR01451 family)